MAEHADADWISKETWADSQHAAAEVLFQHIVDTLKVDENHDVVSETVDLLVDGGITKPWQIKHTPTEVMQDIISKYGSHAHHTLVSYIKTLEDEPSSSAKASDKDDPTLIMAKAMAMMALAECGA